MSVGKQQRKLTSATTGVAAFVFAVGIVAAQEPGSSSVTTPVAQTIRTNHPLVIAHRGASGYLPEHTTEAAAFAHALGADYIEQDVVLTKDGVAVVLHDVTLNEITNVREVYPDRSRENGHWYVMDFTWAELQKLSVHERFSDDEAAESAVRFPRNSARFRIATLDQHLALIDGMNKSRGTKAGVYIEIKSPAEHHRAGLDVSSAVLKSLARHGYLKGNKPVYLQCFDQKEVRRLRTELNCRLPLIQLLSKAPNEAEIAQIGKVADGLGIPITTVVTGTQLVDGEQQPVVTNVVKYAHQHAMDVHVWTFRSDQMPEFCSQPDVLIDWLVRDAGVDGIFSDQPDVILKWRRASTPQAGRVGPFHLLKNSTRGRTRRY